MICQGIYPYRSNSWRIFSHWIEKRISPPPSTPPYPTRYWGYPLVFLCGGGGGGGRTELEEEVFAAKIKTLSLVHPFRSFAAIFISIFSLFFFQFFSLAGSEGERRMRPGQMDHHCFMFRPPSFSYILKKIHLVGRHRNIGWMLDHYQMTLRFFSNS